jgi:hypothetical protein
VNSTIRHVGINIFPKPYSQPISEPKIPVPPIGKYTLHNVKQILGIVKEFSKNLRSTEADLWQALWSRYCFGKRNCEDSNHT